MGGHMVRTQIWVLVGMVFQDSLLKLKLEML